MIVIEGTNKIKGALDLGGINKQLKCGDSLPITDNEYHDHSVQIALKMGWLKEKRDNTKNLPTGKITLKNIYDRSIHINALNQEIRSQQTFSLDDDQVRTSEIQGALAKGLLAIISSTNVVSGTETTIKVGNLFGEKNKEITEEKDLEAIPADFLETNEEIEPTNVIEPSNIIESESPDPIEPTDVPDPKKKSVIWNPNNEPIIHTGNSMDADGKSKDLSFVDKEAEDARRDSHPILKEKPLENNYELDFL